MCRKIVNDDGENVSFILFKFTFIQFSSDTDIWN